MSRSISYATPAIVRYRRKGGPGVLYLDDGRLAFSHGTVLHGPMTVLFDYDLSEISVAGKKHRWRDPTAFDVTFADGGKATCGFWWRADHNPPSVIGQNHAGVRVEDLDLDDKWQAEDACATWLRILADPAAPDPKSWHPT